MNDTEQVLQMPTSEGLAEARKGEQGLAWSISLPWSDREFYGNQTGCRAEMRKLIAAYELASNPVNGESWRYISFVDRVCERFGIGHILIGEAPQVDTRARQPLVACGVDTRKMNWTPYSNPTRDGTCPKCVAVP